MLQTLGQYRLGYHSKIIHEYFILQNTQCWIHIQKALIIHIFKNPMPTELLWVNVEFMNNRGLCHFNFLMTFSGTNFLHWGTAHKKFFFSVHPGTDKDLTAFSVHCFSLQNFISCTQNTHFCDASISDLFSLLN